MLSQPIGIIGAGAAGLITAHVLLQDGFTDVTLVSRDKSVGGTWAQHRVYPGLHINNVHGQYRFSALDMPPPERYEQTGARLTGTAVSKYMETFTEKFLKNKAKFRMEMEVLNIRRNEKGIWLVKTENLRSGSEEILTFSRIILSTGGCSNPSIPANLSPDAAKKAGFGGIVIHSSQFAPCLDEILASVKPKATSNGDPLDAVIVVGGGKSARDMCAKLANEGRKVTNVFEVADAFFAGPAPLPAFIRKSRFMAIFSPHIELRSHLERFLHKTWIGGLITRFLWRTLLKQAFAAYKIPNESPLRRTHSNFWGLRLSDEGLVRPDSFHGLVTAGHIDLAAPTRAIGYAKDGKSLLLSDGRTLPAKVVILATGYQSSWSPIFEKDMAEELGIARHTPTCDFENEWKYASLANPPPQPSEQSKWATSIHRGIVPAKNIDRRDFAIAGALFSADFAHVSEVAAHWTASYFRNDLMRLPSSPEKAMSEGERKSAWMKTRFPQMLSWLNDSHSGSLDFMTWPQAVDELLEDMFLPSLRSGGNWLTWPFKVVDVKEIATLSEERRSLRGTSP